MPSVCVTMISMAVPEFGDCDFISIPRNVLVTLQHDENRRRQRCQPFCQVVPGLPAITDGVEPPAITRDKDGSAATESNLRSVSTIIIHVDVL